MWYDESVLGSGTVTWGVPDDAMRSGIWLPGGDASLRFWCGVDGVSAGTFGCCCA